MALGSHKWVCGHRHWEVNTPGVTHMMVWTLLIIWPGAWMLLVRQIRFWILLGSHTVMGTFLASHTGAHAHDVTQTGEKVMLEVCIGDQE